MKARIKTKKGTGDHYAILPGLLGAFIALFFSFSSVYADNEILEEQPIINARFQGSGLRYFYPVITEGVIGGITVALTDNAGGTSTVLKITCSGNSGLDQWSNFIPNDPYLDSYTSPRISTYFFGNTYDLEDCAGQTQITLEPFGSYFWGTNDPGENPYRVIYGVRVSDIGNYFLSITTSSGDYAATTSALSLGVYYEAGDDVDIYIKAQLYTNGGLYLQEDRVIPLNNPYDATPLYSPGDIDNKEASFNNCGSYILTGVMVEKGNSVMDPDNYIAVSNQIVLNFCGQTLAGLLEITGGFSTTSTSTELVFGCDPDSPLWERSICNVFGFLFIPSQDSLYNFTRLKEAYKNKPPFGYATSIFSSLSGFTGSGTPPFALVVATPALDSVFSPIRTGLIIVFWIMLALYLFKRFKFFEL